MKIITTIACLLLGTAVSFGQSAANSATTFNEEMRRLTHELMHALHEYAEQQVNQGKVIHRADHSAEIIKDINRNSGFNRRREQLYGRVYNKPIVFRKLAGESDRINWLKGIPVPVMPEPALQADPRENEKYADRIRIAWEQMKEDARRLANTTAVAQAHQQGGNAAVKKMYEQQLNQNEFVQQMGGMEKLQNMSEADREKMAKAMVADRTGGKTPEEIRKMTPEQKKALAQQMAASSQQTGDNEVSAAFTRELMVNESFRKRYEAMDQAGRMAAYQDYEKRYYGTDNVAGGNATPGTLKGNADAREIQMLDEYARNFLEEMEQAMQPVRTKMEQNQAIYRQRMEWAKKWTEAATEKLPIVRDSEYGSRRDGLERVDFASHTIAYMIGQAKIQNDREVWENYVNTLLPSFKKLDDLVAAYQRKPNLSDRMKLAIASAMSAGYETILEANRLAGHITTEAATIQYQFNCLVLRNCFDPRSEKYGK